MLRAWCCCAVAPACSRGRARSTPPFPPGLAARLTRSHPLLDDDALALVEQGLRQWFAVCQRAEGEQVAMPSVVVDDLWHELIVHTLAYERYCRAVFGRFLHHTPEEAMAGGDAAANRTWRMRRTYELAVELEGTDLPLLFRVDAALRVRGGRRYVVDCGGGLCAPPPGETCLRHLPLPPRKQRSSDGWAGGTWGTTSSSGGDGPYADNGGWGGFDGGGSGGCGGGGCGGGGS